MIPDVAVVGLGTMGQRHAKSSYKMDDLNLVAGVDVDVDARKKFHSVFNLPAYEDLESLLSQHDIDAVTIATPHSHHYREAKDAASRGLHVFIEKPAVATFEEAIDLLGTVRERDLTLQVGYHRRYYPPLQEVRRLISEGEIGEPTMVNCHIGQRWLEKNTGSWRTNPDLSVGGQLFDAGSHLLEALLWLLDARPQSVTATTSNEGSDVDINSALSLSLSRGDRDVICSVGVSGQSSDFSTDEMFEIIGTDGRITYRSDPRSNETVWLQVAKCDVPSYHANFNNMPGINSMTKRKLEDYADAITSGSEPAVPGEIVAPLAAVREGAVESHENGTRVDTGAMLDECGIEFEHV